METTDGNFELQYALSSTKTALDSQWTTQIRLSMSWNRLKTTDGNFELQYASRRQKQPFPMDDSDSSVDVMEQAEKLPMDDPDLSVDVVEQAENFSFMQSSSGALVLYYDNSSQTQISMPRGERAE
ncbi:hypothetical protein D9758_015529 [Tetrapyrgos nigripes]|uniref:Uncharacterized protein n=1 Tax=Tetrapyrgos nigripes TaxID=182062 RepID=A0A8H5FTQ2_9AGAR|nr:hypothetical protein D9758_015529 [Tetrapyrgos nigripes]